MRGSLSVLSVCDMLDLPVEPLFETTRIDRLHVGVEHFHVKSQILPNSCTGESGINWANSNSCICCYLQICSNVLALHQILGLWYIFTILQNQCQPISCDVSGIAVPWDRELSGIPQTEHTEIVYRDVGQVRVSWIPLIKSRRAEWKITWDSRIGLTH